MMLVRAIARCARELICLPRKRKFRAALRQTGTTGKSLLLFRNRVKPVAQKSASVLPPISG
jgi:hypothetical protein